MLSSDKSPDYNLTYWCDFVRGVADPGVEEDMRAEIARSRHAQKTLEAFGRLQAVAEADRAIEVPAHALRVVKAIAGVHPHTSASSSLRFLPFHVIFDSFGQAAHAGIRDLTSSHQWIKSFDAMPFSVHVKLEQETNPHTQIVVGQLLRQIPEPKPVAEIPVLVLADGRIVGRSVTSAFGEFQADSLPPESLELRLLVSSDECIGLPLGNLPHD